MSLIDDLACQLSRERAHVVETRCWAVLVDLAAVLNEPFHSLIERMHLVYYGPDPLRPPVIKVRVPWRLGEPL